ncbi:MAG: SGNH/GDSL hydrolase family protein [Chromatiales bacterium]|nr:SGNH/GDSL hydrolase family protein [Chromatiales bacterium]
MSRSRSRVLVLRVASVLAGLALAMVLAEAVLWVTGWNPPKVLTKRYLTTPGPPPKTAYSCYPGNPNGEFSAAPDVSQGGGWELFNPLLPPERMPLSTLPDTPWCVEYRMLASGLRDRDYAAVPAPGMVRIIGMGDSFVFGEGVQLEDTLFRQFERQTGPGVEVVNGGWPGIGTRVELERLQTLLRQLGARRAIVVFTANDIDMTPELESRQTYINDLINIRDRYLEDHEARAWYSGSGRLLRYVGSILGRGQVARDTIRWYQDMYDPIVNADGLRAFAGYLGGFVAIPETRVVLVLYPLMEGLEGTYPLQRVHDRVAAMAREAGLPVLDLAPAFRGQRTRDMWVHDTDHHPNARAHGIAADAIAAWLAREIPDFLASDPIRLPARQ